jgi:hypothetical protein
MRPVGSARRPVINPTFPWFDLSSHARNPMSSTIVHYDLTEALLSHITQTPALEEGSRSFQYSRLPMCQAIATRPLNHPLEYAPSSSHVLPTSSCWLSFDQESQLRLYCRLVPSTNTPTHAGELYSQVYTPCLMPSISSISAVVTAMHRSMFHGNCWPMIYVDLSITPASLRMRPLSLARPWSSPSPLSSSAARTYHKHRHIPSILNYALSQHCSSLCCTLHAASKHLGLNSTCRKSFCIYM